MAGYREVAPGTELTEREQQMLADHDAGLSAQDLADKYSYANANAAGNVVRRALTKAGRENEIGQGQRRAAQGTTSPRPRRNNVEDTVVDPVQQMLQIRERGLEQVNEFRAELNEMERDRDMDQDAVLDRERERLELAITKAQQALEEFEGWSDERKTSYFDTFSKSATSRYDGQHEHLEAAIAKAEKAVSSAESFLDAMEVDYSGEQDSDEDSDDEGNEGDES